MSRIASEIILKKIMDLQVVLLNKHKLPTLFSYNSKVGQVNFGSKTVMSKFGREFTQEWEDAFETDLDDLMTQTPSKDYYDEEEWGSPILFARSELLPWKLPADLDLMIYKELWKWISAEILKEHWKNGGEYKEVHYSQPEFLASFWPNEIWDWENIEKNPNNMKASDFPGTGNMTEFLKLVVRNRLEQLEIDPATYISKDFTEKKEKE